MSFIECLRISIDIGKKLIEVKSDNGHILISSDMGVMC